MNKRIRGSVMLVVIFLITFMLGGFLINHMVIRNRGIKIKSKIEGINRSMRLKNMDEIVFHEMYEAQQKIKAKKYNDIIEHFAKNEKNDRIWGDDLFSQESKYSYGGYAVKEIRSNGVIIYKNNDMDTPKNRMQTCLNAGHGIKIEIILQKEDILFYESKTKEIIYEVYVELEYYHDNKDIFSPDIEKIDKIEVWENG